MTKMYLSTLKRKWLLAAVFALATGAMASSASARDGEMAHHKGHHQWSQASLQAQASAVVTQDMVRITLASELTGTSQTARSEEHTSELQSLMRLSYAVLCLKKKN